MAFRRLWVNMGLGAPSFKKDKNPEKVVFLPKNASTKIAHYLHLSGTNCNVRPPVGRGGAPTRCWCRHTRHTTAETAPRQPVPPAPPVQKRPGSTQATHLCEVWGADRMR